MPILSNSKHELFAQELAKGRSASEAYRTVFGKDNRRYASTLGQRDDISGRVQDILSETAKQERDATERACAKLSLTKEWVIGRLIENVDRSMQAVEITREGKGTGEYRYDGAVANRALELLGKEIGMFVDRSEVREIVDIRDAPLPPEERDREWLETHGTGGSVLQ